MITSTPIKSIGQSSKRLGPSFKASLTATVLKQCDKLTKQCESCFYNFIFYSKMSLTIILVHKIGTNLGGGKNDKKFTIVREKKLLIHHLSSDFLTTLSDAGTLWTLSPKGNFIQMSLEVEFRQKFNSIGKEVFSWK